jgi:hypothetical protein
LIFNGGLGERGIRAERQRDNERYCESEFASHLSWILLTVLVQFLNMLLISMLKC